MKGFLKEYNSIMPRQFLNPDLQYKSSPRQTKKTTVSPQEKEKLWEVQFSSSLTNLHKERCQEGNYASSSKRRKWRSSFLVLSHTHTKTTSTFHFLILAHDFFYTCTCIFTNTSLYLKPTTGFVLQTWHGIWCSPEDKKKMKIQSLQKNTEKTLKINWNYGSILLA